MNRLIINGEGIREQIAGGGEELNADVIEKIEELLKNYKRMLKEIDRLESALYRGGLPDRSWGVAQYGLDAAMPKGNGGISRAELTAMDKRDEYLYKRIKELAEKVNAVDMVLENINSEIHRMVFDCMVDGMSYRSISKHLGISRDKVKQIKDEIISQLSQNSQIQQVLKLEKLTV
jgi:hypothetical protein